MEANDVLSFEERQGLTIWGHSITVQMRDQGTLALHIKDSAVRTQENFHPVLVPSGDVEKLRALLEESKRREED